MATFFHSSDLLGVRASRFVKAWSWIAPSCRRNPMKIGGSICMWFWAESLRWLTCFWSARLRARCWNVGLLKSPNTEKTQGSFASITLGLVTVVVFLDVTSVYQAFLTSASLAAEKLMRSYPRMEALRKKIEEMVQKSERCVVPR